MSCVFADAHFVIALLSRRDAQHERSVEAYRSGDFEEIVTTVWVLTELADGMSRPGARAVCHRFIERLRADEGVRIVKPIGICSGADWLSLGNGKTKTGRC